MKPRFIAIAGLTLALLLPGSAFMDDVPDAGTLTRAEGTAMLLLARDTALPLIQNAGKFRDVYAGQWYEQYMLAGEREGIIQADPNTQELRPEEYLNRAEFLKMISLTFHPQSPTVSTYEDVKSDAWYAPYAGIAQQYHLFPNDALPDQLNPETLITQNEAADALAILLKALDGQAGISSQHLQAQEATIGDLTLSLMISQEQQRAVYIAITGRSGRAVEVKEPVQELRTEVLDLVNTVRVKYGLKPYKYNALLEKSAQLYAEQMAKEHFFSHESPEGETLQDRLQKVGYYNRSFSLSCLCVRGYVLGENLAEGQTSPQEAFDAWMKSPLHRAAILSPDYSETGIGIQSDIWVEHFGTVLLPQWMKIFGIGG